MISVEGLTVAASSPLVQGVSFEICGGERVGLIGESGSGKSLTALALMGLLPEGLSATGEIRFHGKQLLSARERELSRLRGNELAMVFQEPMSALNPLMRAGRQVAESIRLHGGKSRRAASRRAQELLESVQLPDAYRAYPHQLSGGQRQRVMLAIALANDPSLLICDEPTTALDVTVQAQVLDLILTGVTERSTALLFITHDLAVVARVCERVLVMLDGRIVEEGSTREVLTNPAHAYTRKLLAASDLEVA
ncbi:ATP-binding cassette domain-containing protein [Amycolatopsis pithecellobii]|uniref:ATP-binding cassette domain-containing protein n=1 Tax=Amycolatopsis pithecellobii TaxID=664692 RepID=A0A6N7ZCR4_9PSEU|nr:ABC transporter ATP-binding protein [Amycolatopsis pithecellobii]MTD59407.1 ATP-binding cassette domain-containing protein [Amycolatopsis pithecellobii]